MSERRYSEDEVAEILDRATETHEASGGALTPGGLTLGELQEIGDEVGIPRDVIARAAASLEQPGPDPAAHRTFLGATIGVGQSVDLPRALTDDEWNQLVVDLRMTFDAKGKIRQEGAFRQWTNGNLQALLEPTATGERLRLRTLKGSAMPYMTTGSIMLTAAAFIGVANSLGAGFGSDIGVIALMGAAFFAAGRFGLPRWASTRQHQMEGIIQRLRGTILPSPEPGALPPGAGEPAGRERPDVSD